MNAAIIMQFLQHYREQLRELRRNSPQTRELAALTQDRRAFVEQRVALSNCFMIKIKAYFPAVFELKPARAYSEFVVGLVARYPTREQAQKAGKTKLRKLFYGKSSQTAKHALAFQWIRIIFRLWQSKIAYSDSHYTQRLNATGSPLAKIIHAAQCPSLRLAFSTTNHETNSPCTSCQKRKSKLDHKNYNISAYLLT
jgi:hypothetical protein